MAKRKQKASDFVISQDSANSLALTIRCQEWVITKNEGDDLTEEDVQLFAKIEAML